jgi:Na+-transporting methylmalonyl-CoA/oxaloacetate decarboxylase gamma subunit
MKMQYFVCVAVFVLMMTLFGFSFYLNFTGFGNWLVFCSLGCVAMLMFGFISTIAMKIEMKEDDKEEEDDDEPSE